MCLCVCSNCVLPAVYVHLHSNPVLSLQCVSRGELLVSLSYQPVTHRLNVVVLKAKHLPKMDISGLSGSEFNHCVCLCVPVDN